MAALCVTAVTLAMVLAPSDCVNPGVRARVTQRGLDYVNQLAVDAMTSDVRKLKIPDQSGEVLAVSYSLKNIRVNRFSLPSTKLLPRGSSGLQWSSGSGVLSVHADWRYTSIFATHSGTLSAEVTGIAISFDLHLGRNASGRPRLAMADCRDGTRSVSIQFHGGTSFLSLVKGMVERAFRGKLRGQFCKAIGEAVHTKAQKYIDEFPTSRTVAERFLLDLRLLAAPTTAPGYLDTRHKGEMFWKDAPQEAPIPPPSREPQFGEDRMLYLALSDYVANSMSWAGFQHRYLVYNLSQAQLPANVSSVLNTSCVLFCIGKLLPQIGTRFPNTSVSLDIRATEPPALKMTPDLISLVARGNVDMMAQLPAGRQAFLLSMNVSLQLNGSASLQGARLVGKVAAAEARVGVLKSAIGEVKSETLQFLMNSAMKVFILPQLNERAARGLVVPLPAELRLVSPQLVIQESFLVVATDVQYKMAGNDVIQPRGQVKLESSPLVFRPHSPLEPIVQ